MRPVFAALLAMMLVVATASDRVGCVDGCTDDAEQEGASAPPPPCGLCHGWSGPQAIDLGAPAELTVATLETGASRELPAHVTPLDHPPRLADVYEKPLMSLAA